jgi:hypothetical protein
LVLKNSLSRESSQANSIESGSGKKQMNAFNGILTYQKEIKRNKKMGGLTQFKGGFEPEILS